MSTEEFVQAHLNGDVRQLALQAARYPEVDMPWALDQIRGWQMARSKLPEWAEARGIIYPPHLSMEQCSSEQTALYKAKVAGRGDVMVDLTGGFGVDMSYMARGYGKAVYVERQEHLCTIARHNMQVLGLDHVSIVNTEAEHYIGQMERVEMIFIDPARRSATGQRTYSIADCTPDVCQLMPQIREKAERCMIKLSPMLDWHDAVARINKSAGTDVVEQVHIVSVRNECKELLLVCRSDGAGKMTVCCANDDSVFEYDGSEQCQAQVAADATKASWLLVPNASVMKAGCFGEVSERYGVAEVDKNSHLYVSDRFVEGFPGKQYAVRDVCTMNRKELKRCLAGVTHANVAVRNFRMSADELRKRLKLTDGGTTYVFGTSVGREQLVYVCCAG